MRQLSDLLSWTRGPSFCSRSLSCDCAEKLCGFVKVGPVRIRHSSHDFGWQSSHSVDLAGWQANMASIEIWIP